jgi:hypothetical protein
VVLDFWELRDLSLKSLRAELGGVRSLDELGVDAQRIRDSPHAALQDVAHRQFAPDLPNVDRTPRLAHSTASSKRCWFRLEPLAEPGGICISATVYEHVRAKLSYPFEDRGLHTLKNIAAPLHIYGLGLERIASLPTEAPSSVIPIRRWVLSAVAVGVAVVGAAALWLVWPAVSPPADEATGTQPALPGTLASVFEPALQTNPPRLSIVVLPFANGPGFGAAILCRRNDRRLDHGPVPHSRVIRSGLVPIIFPP